MTETLFPEIEARPGESVGWFIAHCDGGSRGNPGPAGYGAVIQDPKGNIVARLSDYLGRQTNNFAEYKGLLAVLSWAVSHGAKRLRVISDSELMVKQMKGQYKVANPGLRALWEEAKGLSKQLEGFEIRHTLRGGNREADQLANEAMDKGTGQNRDQGSGVRNQRQPVDPRPGKPEPARTPRKALEGYVKNGVVHLLEGDLPDGTFVQVIQK